MIGGDGSPVYQGRSLIYRSAMTAALPAVALGGGRTDGRFRRASGLVLERFLSDGAVVNGLLPLGWRGDFPAMAQAYSGPASPYWMSKAFISLLLSPDAEYWTVPEQPLPIEEADFVRTEPAVGWMLTGTREDGIVRLGNHGAVRTRALRDPHSMPIRDDPDYARLAYSTATGPVLDGLQLDGPRLDGTRLDTRRERTEAISWLPDNSIVVAGRSGLPLVRESSTVIASGPAWIRSRFLLVEPEADEASLPVDVRSLYSRGSEVRLFRIGAQGVFDVMVTGYPLGRDGHSSVDVMRSVRTVSVRSGLLVSTVRALSRAGTGTGTRTPDDKIDLVVGESGPTAFGATTTTPGILFRDVVGGTWHAYVCSLSGSGDGNASEAGSGAD